MNRAFLRSAKILLTSLLLCTACLEIWLQFVPRAVVSVPVPDSTIHVRVERWWGTFFKWDRYELVVENDRDEARAILVENWGPANRVNLYSTPSGAVVALASGGAATFIDFRSAAPFVVLAKDHPADDSQAWTYLGATDWSPTPSRLEFHPPSEQIECFPMLGAGTSPYRKQFQNEHFCPNT